jgi:hypothetical protein
MSDNKEIEKTQKEKKTFKGIYYKDSYLEFGPKLQIDSYFTGDKFIKVAGKVLSTIIKECEEGLEKCSDKEIKFGVKNNKSGAVKYYCGIKSISKNPTEFTPLKVSRDENGKVKLDENGKVIREPIMIVDKETGKKVEKKIIYNYDTDIKEITEDEFYGEKSKPEEKNLKTSYNFIINDFCKRKIINKNDLKNEDIKKIINELCLKFDEFDFSFDSTYIHTLDKYVDDCKFNILKTKVNYLEDKIKELEKTKN